MPQKIPPSIAENLVKGFLAKWRFSSHPLKEIVESSPVNTQEVMSSSVPLIGEKEESQLVIQEISRRNVAYWIMALMVLRYVVLLVIMLVPGSPLLDRIVEMLVSDRVLDGAFKAAVHYFFTS